MAEITVNGRPYTLITVDDFTLDEAIVVWDYTKLSLDQIPDMEGFHPGLVAALIHVSVSRAEPGETQKTIRQTVGAIKVSELEQIFAGISVEADDVPPPKPPETSSPPAGSGGASQTTSASPASSPENGTGSPGSAIGAIFDPRTSAT